MIDLRTPAERDAIRRQLQRFAGRLECWRDVIQRSTLVDAVEVVLEDEWVEVRATWRGGRYFRAWGWRSLLGDLSGPPHTWRVRRCACDYARDVIRALQEKRGIV